MAADSDEALGRPEPLFIEKARRSAGVAKQRSADPGRWL